MKIQTVSRKTNTLFNKIRSDKGRRNKFDTPGIYKIPLHRENEIKYYIGRTQKSIKTRLQQHKDNVRNKNNATTLTESVLNEGWKPEWELTEVLAKPTTLTRSMLAEYLEIRDARHNLVNAVEESEKFEHWRNATGKYN